MLRFESRQGVKFCDGLTRRDFLHTGSLAAGALSLSLAELNLLQGAEASREKSCILLFLVGGPSQLETWDLKPHAPTNIRGPFRPIATKVPGIQIGEHFPRMAALADRFAIVRSLHHDEAPIHETGHQLLQTGRLCRGQEFPHIGAAMSHLQGLRQSGVPPFVVLPGPLGSTGVNVSHGQAAGILGEMHEPWYHRPGTNSLFRLRNDDAPYGLDPARLPSRQVLLNAIDQAQRHLEGSAVALDPVTVQALDQVLSSRARAALDLAREPVELRDRYGRNTFGQSCLTARRLVEHGVRLVTVNMFDTVFNQVTWDCHADQGALPATLEDYQTTLCPMLDRAYSTLLLDLESRGLLENTLVLATGEFGRTPQLNPRGGRDHWPGVWSALLAGGGIRGGQVIGASDRLGAEPADRPVSPAEITATVYHSLGIDPRRRLPLPGGGTIPLVEAEPIKELFRG